MEEHVNDTWRKVLEKNLLLYNIIDRFLSFLIIHSFFCEVEELGPEKQKNTTMQEH